MLFRKKIQRSCAYCKKGTHINDDSVLCIKRGIMPSIKSCHRFTYDPCKRIPKKPKATNFSEYVDTDYSL